MTGWLIATERTWGILLLQLWVSGQNIGLDLWFVLGLGRGIRRWNARRIEIEHLAAQEISKGRPEAGATSAPLGGYL